MCGRQGGRQRPARTRAPSPARADDAPAAGGGKAGGGGGGGGGSRAPKRKKVYEQHLPAGELAAGVAAGRLHQGALRVSRRARAPRGARRPAFRDHLPHGPPATLPTPPSRPLPRPALHDCDYNPIAPPPRRFNPFEGWVSSQSVGEDILVSGRIDMNRAIDGARGGGEGAGGGGRGGGRGGGQGGERGVHPVFCGRRRAGAGPPAAPAARSRRARARRGPAPSPLACTLSP